MGDFEIIGWPDIQEYMEWSDFRDNAALIDSNEKLGISSSTYLVSKEWLEELNERK